MHKIQKQQKAKVAERTEEQKNDQQNIATFEQMLENEKNNKSKSTKKKQKKLTNLDDNERIIYEGAMYRRTNTKNWERIWFKLFANCTLMSYDLKSRKLIDSLYLGDIIEFKKDKRLSAEREDVIIVNGLNDIYWMLKCDEREELVTWYNEIETLLKTLKESMKDLINTLKDYSQSTLIDDFYHIKQFHYNVWLFDYFQQEIGQNRRCDRNLCISKRRNKRNISKCRDDNIYRINLYNTEDNEEIAMLQHLDSLHSKRSFKIQYLFLNISQV